jgi:ABC-type enterochelin transport system permease subunit
MRFLFDSKRELCVAEDPSKDDLRAKELLFVWRVVDFANLHHTLFLSEVE